MLIEENIIIKLTRKNYQHYHNLKYVGNPGDTIQILNSHLSKGSHTKVNCKCDYCGSLNQVIFKNYYKSTQEIKKYCCKKIECLNKKIIDINQIRYGVDNVFQLNETKEKSKETLFKNFGVKHQMFSQQIKDKIFETNINKYGYKSPSQNQKVKDKTVLTNLKKYGVEHISQLESFQNIKRQKRLKNSKQINPNLMIDYSYYRHLVDLYTDRNRKKLYEMWNGYDYYDDEYIRDNNIICSNYPSIDHKISCYYGFINNIDPKIISEIDNLCITKMGLNSKKWNRNEIEFKEILKNEEK
jgi:hypothetical protein